MAGIVEYLQGLYNEIRNISTVNFTSDTDRTVTAIEARYKVIKLTDTAPYLTTSRNAIFPTEVRSWTVQNATTKTITAKTAAGTGVSIPAGKSAMLRCDGTNIISEFDYLPLISHLRGHISGFVWSNNATDPNNDIDISAGVCVDSTNTVMMVGSALTKRLDAAWAAGTNQGGLDTGTKAALTEYYIHEILKASDQSTDIILSTSRTSPTLPSGYPNFRHIGWCKTDGGGNILGFVATEMAGGGVNFQWKVPIGDVGLSNILTTTARLDTLSVMTGVKVMPIAYVETYDASAAHYSLLTDPDTTDTAPNAGLHTTSGTVGTSATTRISCLTDTSRQIRARSTLATVDSYVVTTLGFEWSRR